MVEKKDRELTKTEWNILKNAVLGVPFDEKWVKKIPPRLQDHQVTILIRKYQKSKQERYLNQAAKILAGGIDNPWLLLGKS